ncbi:MAG: phosphatase PAP2 family protein [Lachnospiraceae bacterium]|nr:phosphatase PAP2 family protein [Lachnospiraceae bacterium]MDY5742448.1 phosphatase PAP2 family protein [Lachnospiraceae bacterium]
MNKSMEPSVGLQKSWLPRKGTVWPLLFGFFFNLIIYTGTSFILRDGHRWNIESSIDMAVPVLPIWSLIYLGCYLFWGVNYVLAARLEKSWYFRFAAADILSRVFCFVIFVLYPTTNTRPPIVGAGIWDQVLAFIYRIDEPVNLFPSIHCLVSWFCYIGIRGRREIPKWYQIFSAVFAGLVFLSTQFTKQHVWIDIIGGVLLAEISWWLSGYLKLGDKYRRAWEGLYTRIGKLLGRNKATDGNE